MPVHKVLSLNILSRAVQDFLYIFLVRIVKGVRSYYWSERTFIRQVDRMTACLLRVNHVRKELRAKSTIGARHGSLHARENVSRLVKGAHCARLKILFRRHHLESRISKSRSSLLKAVSWLRLRHVRGTPLFWGILPLLFPHPLL